MFSVFYFKGMRFLAALNFKFNAVFIGMIHVIYNVSDGIVIQT